jgi:3,4-dihydroxy 2-butanone 4-phosphate synthase/GTP cyclohydrolase II
MPPAAAPSSGPFSPKNPMALSPLSDVLAAFARGEIIILVDDEARENEGDLVIAAEKVTPEAINFMAKYGRGLICLSMTGQQLEKLGIPLMVPANSSVFETAFTVSIEARHGVTTGISAADRAHTILVAVDEDASPADLVMPGHIFPLRAKDGGVLVRTGQTEGSVDLARLAGLKPAAVICEILNDDGTMARMEDLETFAREHNLLIASVADIIAWRLQTDDLVERLAETAFPCEASPDFRLRVYRDAVDGGEHLALILGDPASAPGPVPVRVQHQAVVGDVFRARDADCGWQLHGALQAIADHGCGVFVYLHQRESSRLQTVRRYLLDDAQRAELDARMPELALDPSVNRPHPHFRSFGIGAQILRDCGVRSMVLLSNNEKKLVGLDAYGLELVETQPIPVPAWSKAGRTTP